MSISPWDNHAEQESPDGRYTAVYDEAMEIAMGAPTRGTLTVREKGCDKPLLQIPDASGSFIWSSDSSAIAYPRWTPGRKQTLWLATLPGGRTEQIQGHFRVLQLESFTNGLLTGTDSPIHQSEEIAIQLPGQTKKAPPHSRANLILRILRKFRNHP